VYDAKSNSGVRWDDPDIGVAWPLPAGTAPVLSGADAAAPLLSAAVCFA